MLKLVSKPDVVPNSLFITSTIEIDHIEHIGAGGFGNVFQARYGGQLVALKMVYQVPSHHARVRGFSFPTSECKQFAKDSVMRHFYTEALTWQSLSHHQFILPFLGIYRDIRGHSKQLLFLVSPLITNGTLSHWRKRYAQAVQVNEIQRLVRC